MFNDILGHDGVLNRLTDALSDGRLPHGLLFAGPVGVGKATVAEQLAIAFLGGTDDVAHRIRGGNHPDYHVVTRQLIRHHDATGKSKAIDLTVKVIRPELVEPANRKSIEGVGKVFVVEEAETMNAAAQNALLKTLEEPHGRTLIVLLTDRPESLLPTVRSRCQTFRFGELSDADAVKVLANGGVNEEDAKQAVAIAGGSPGRATRFLEDGVIESAGELFRRLDDRSDMSDFLQKAAERQAAADLERDPLGSKDSFTRSGLALYLGLAADHLRRRLVDGDQPELLCEQIDAVARAERYLDANVNVGLALRQLDLALA